MTKYSTVIVRIFLISFFVVVTIGSGGVSASSKDDGDVSQVKLVGLRVAGSSTHVRLVLDIEGRAAADGLLLGAPYRYAIDLPGAKLALINPKASGQPGFLKRIRYGKSPDGNLRLIVESKVPLTLTSKFAVAPTTDTRGHLVFDFAKASEVDFRRAIAAQAEILRQKEVAKKTAKNETGRAQKGDLFHKTRKKRIVIDPGHGGKDGGARSQSGVLEKEIVLTFAKKLADNLNKLGDYDVFLTRVDDSFVSLSGRVNKARQLNADLFVSVHADSLPEDRRVRGTTIYTVSEKASDQMAATIAAQQNKSEAIAGYDFKEAPDEVIDILFDLTRRESSNLSIAFAHHIHNDMRSTIRFFKQPLQRAAFTVLRVPDIPSALIELGFLSNSKDAELLSSDEWRSVTAQKMAQSIDAYFNKRVIGLVE